MDEIPGKHDMLAWRRDEHDGRSYPLVIAPQVGGRISLASAERRANGLQLEGAAEKLGCLRKNVVSLQERLERHAASCAARIISPRTAL